MGEWFTALLAINYQRDFVKVTDEVTVHMENWIHVSVFMPSEQKQPPLKFIFGLSISCFVPVTVTLPHFSKWSECREKCLC